MSIKFETSAQQKCYEKVHLWLKEMFGEMVVPRDDIPGFMVPLGSSLTHIFISSWGNDDSTVTALAYVVREVELSNDLMYFLLKEGHKMRFGSFGLDQDDDICFEHTISGGNLDKNELKASVKAVMEIADQYDDQIVSKWGGRRGLD
jgi:hypothetical protein